LRLTPEDRRRLLLIDDSEIIVAVMGAKLTDAGFDVRAVTSLRAFLNAVLDFRPHLIVTDLYMPEMSGAALTKWLRAQIRTSRTPIVICSSAPEVELSEVTRDAGADAFVSKEAGPEALARQLHSLCDDIVW
jgi:CheY-like chemotaxis protein